MSKKEEKAEKAKARTLQKAAEKPNEALMEAVVRDLDEKCLRVAQVRMPSIGGVGRIKF